MFADDTKLYCPVKTIDDCQQLQSDLNSLSNWSSKWLLKFNESKCVVLRIKHSLDYIYSLNGFPLREVPHQKDLGVIVSNTLLPHDHIQSVTKKSNQWIGLLRRCFTDITLNKVEILFNSLIRPLLEYGSPAWNPWYSKDITNIEKVQRRCYKLCNSPEFEPEPLVIRRLKTDICEVYKYLHDMYKTDKSLFFYTITAHSTRAQLEARQTLRSYTHQVKVLITPSSQHLEQPTGRRGQLTVAGRLQR